MHLLTITAASLVSTFIEDPVWGVRIFCSLEFRLAGGEHFFVGNVHLLLLMDDILGALNYGNSQDFRGLWWCKMSSINLIA